MPTSAFRAPLRPPVPLESPGASWLRAFEPLPREHGFEPLRVEGRLPEDLVGTLYCVGPASFSAFGQRLSHWFDGDGAVTAVRFGGGAQGAVRFVETQHRAQEQRAGRLLYARFGTVVPGGLLQRMRVPAYNCASTSVFRWQGRLFALYEACLPTELAPGNLATLGETDLGGAVLQCFSAHPHRVPERRATYNVGARFGAGWMKLDVFELPDSGPARRLTTVPLPAMTMVHDFIATPRHLLFLVPPLRIHPLRLVLGLEPLSRNFTYEPSRGTEVIVLPLDAPERPVRFTVDAFFQWHFGNAFEQGGELVVDLVRYEDFRSNRLLAEMLSGETTTPASGLLHRLRIDPVRRRLAAEPLWDVPCEYPRPAPAVTCHEGRYLYLTACTPEARHGPQDLLARWDHVRRRAVTVSPGPDQYPSEPVFVPRRGATREDEGYLLSLVYDARAHATQAVVYDAQQLERGPLARAWFNHHIPFTVHGLWAE